MKGFIEHTSFYVRVQAIYLFLLLPYMLHSQEFVCGMHHVDIIDSTANQTRSSCIPQLTNTPTYLYPELYLPSSLDNPIHVRINLIFVQRNDGSGNYQEDNEDHQVFLSEAMDDLNNRYAYLAQTLDYANCYVGSSFISDTKIRFEYRKYYIRDEYGWNSNGASGLHCDYLTWYLSYLDEQIRQCDTIPAGINVFFTEDIHHYTLYENGDTTAYLGGAACSRFPNFSNMSFSSRVHMPEYYSMYWCKVILQHPNVNDSVHAVLRSKYAKWLDDALAHELGHSLGLYHPINDYNYTDSYVNCINTIMRQESGMARNFLSPFKVGIIHYSLMGSNLQNYVPENAYAGTKSVTQDVSFPRMRFYHSLSIQSNVTMTCESILPEQAVITLNNGGLLNVDGGYLHSIADDWNGIVVNEGGALILSNTMVSDYNIEVKEGGKIIVAGDITLSGNHKITINNGGCICIDENAVLTLSDSLSIIEIAPNAYIDCENTTNSHCVTSMWDVTTRGNGMIAAYNEDNYIQNETISTTKLVTGSSVLAGYDVTNTKPVGEVVVTSSGHLVIQAVDNVILTRDVEIQQGGVLEIR